ncbi:apyrase-like [Pieris brassicae]|uniref:apyrase-like n=1 Tax=Pieris brassicae TaxID=7116 RepID=UPI001E65E7EF|nr:apyrase-like [Pieris brassicae]
MFLDVLLCALFGSVSASVINSGVFRLDIVHYNDFHARFEETTVHYPICSTNDSQCLGGYARLYHEIKTLLAQKPGALLLNAGDTFQGTYWYTLLKWNITQKFINLLPNDAHAIGNHEFDDGIAGLAPYLAALHAPVVAANIDTSQEPALNDLYKPHIVVERKGRRIGIIGLITTETQMSSSPGKVKFLDPIKSAKTEADALTEKGVDIIILLSHCGLDVDKKIAKQVGENIDIIVGGHSHSLLWNGESPSHEEIAGPYPVIVESELRPGHKIPIVTASAFTKYVGNLTAYFNRNGDLLNFEGTPVFLDRDIPEDLAIKALLKPYQEQLHSVVKEIIGVANDNLIMTECGGQECAIGDMFADAVLSAGKEIADSNLTHVAFLLRNTIRGSLSKGEISRGDLINTLPFTNDMVTFVIPGKYILEAFKTCTTSAWVRKPFSGPWLPQVAGLKLTLNLTGEIPEVEVLVKEGGDYQLLDPQKEYQLSTINFVIKEGGTFDMLRKHGRDFKIVGKDVDVVEKYIKKISPITLSLDNRLTVIN